MTYRIRDLRNLDINIYGFVASGLRNNGYTVLSGYSFSYITSGIYLVDGFPEDYEDIKIPAIAIEFQSSNYGPLQLGTGKEPSLRFNIDVFARSDGERDDLGEMVKNYFDSSMNIFDYNSVLRSGWYNHVGIADFDNMTMFPIRETAFRTTKHMMRLSFDCIYTVGSGSSLI